MKKFLMGLGLLTILILLLLQIRFKNYMVMEQDGYAVMDGSIKDMLLADPYEGLRCYDTEFYTFSASDRVFSRGSSYYMGEKKKTKIDLAFPFLVNGGAGVYFIDDSALLYDTEYQTASTYRGLTISDGISYNPDGTRADACSFLFGQLSNNIYVNFQSFDYMDGDTERNVKANSFLFFSDTYFAYCEQDGNIARYQVALNLTDNSIFIINGETLTYRELLLRIHVISERVNGKPDKEKDDDKDDIDYEAEIGEETDETTEQVVTTELEVATEEPTTEAQKEPETTEEPETANNDENENDPDDDGRGVRPDSERPDKQRTETTPEEEEIYIKPEAAINSVKAGVYRIMLDITVKDPANRLHSLRKVQFEFYEINESTQKETLAYRTYTGSTSIVTAGAGAIKPETTYKVVAYYTYYNENNEITIEYIDLEDAYVKTGSVSDLGPVVIRNETVDGVSYNSIPYYYDNKLVIENVMFDEALSDPEAIYGIKSSGGMVLLVNGNNRTYNTTIDPTKIGGLKNKQIVVLDSSANLKADSKYSYELTIKDYFGNALTIENNKGLFETCKPRPSANIVLKKNIMGDIQFAVSVADAYKSAVPNADGEYDVYFVLSTEKLDNFTWEDCENYLANAGRVFDDAENESCIHYVEKLPGDCLNQELLDARNGSHTFDIGGLDCLDLNTKYYAYVLADYDLNNKRGLQLHDEIGYFTFKSASLSSLGNIYVNVSISDITYNGANIVYSLNMDRTNDVLAALLSHVQFDITASFGAEASCDSSFVFSSDENAETLANFKAGTPVTYGSIDTLSSVTDYVIKPTMYATYNGKQYPMNITLTEDHFKTLKQPPTVTMTNVLFAGELISFDVLVEDKDEAIVGNSSNTVVLNVYDNSQNFVKAIRINKNEPVHVEFTGMDPTKNYILYYIAVDYNEGYTNATAVSNKVIYTTKIQDAIKITGTIKLQELAYENDAFLAHIKTVIADDDRILDGTAPYYINVYKDDVDITNTYGSELTQIESYTYGEDTERNVITTSLSYAVQKGNHTYTYELWVTLSGRKIVLDTLSFTTEDTIAGIKNGYEFITKIKEDPTGRYCFTDNIDLLESGKRPVDENGIEASQAASTIASIFSGEIDGQGYTLSFGRLDNSAAFFTNIGPNAEIYDIVCEFTMESTTAMSYKGFWCRYNYGHFHDIFVHYMGGSVMENYYCGLLCEQNSASGVIENFIVKNDAVGDLAPFTCRREAGLLCYYNYGTIRNGYAYGYDIYTTGTKPSDSAAIYVGGLVGRNVTPGVLGKVYSLINVSISHQSKNANNKETTHYGSVAGYSSGKYNGGYGIGQSSYIEAYTNGQTTYTYNPAIGPVVGNDSKKLESVYYFNEDDNPYDAAISYQKAISLSSLYDYGWQANLLGEHYTTTPVEVGYYPHLLYSEEMPEQEYIPLPSKNTNYDVEVVSSQVLEYAEDGQSARVEFRLNNQRNAAITAIEIKDLSCDVDQSTMKSLDGYTTLQATVYNPVSFLSAYEITAVKYSLSNSSKTQTFDKNPLLLVDFYRLVADANDWYNYVVLKPKENARLVNDIDFSSVTNGKYITVKDDYYGKLDGNGHALNNITMTSSSSYYRVFANVYGELFDFNINDMTLGARGFSNTGFVTTLYGSIHGVNLSRISITGRDYITSLVRYAQPGANIYDCTANAIELCYEESANTASTAYIGGLVAYLNQSTLSNCYVRDVNIVADDIGVCNGAGGLVGYSYYSKVESVYTTGQIVVRGINVGGVIGSIESDNMRTCYVNMLSNVSVTNYQGAVGGLIGTMKLDSALTETNNLSGLAYGNVFCANPDAAGISYTVGYNSGMSGKMCGCEEQLLNGTIFAGVMSDDSFVDENTKCWLSAEEIRNPSYYTDPAYVNMSAVDYDLSKVKEGLFPVLYYDGTKIPLPGQTDIPLRGKEELEEAGEIDVYKVVANASSKYIYLQINGPSGYQVLDVTIEDLKYSYNPSYGNGVIGSNGVGLYGLSYNENDQTRFKDSYNLTAITYMDDKGVTHTQSFQASPVRVPLTLYATIHNISDWQKYINTETSGNYDNYRVTGSINFSLYTYARNAKIGRLVGDSASEIVFSGINLVGANQNFIFRLNSQLANITFRNCVVASTSRNNVGLIGTSAANITNVTFDNITINDTATNIMSTAGVPSRSFMGIIGYQVAGNLGSNETDGRITLKDVKVGTSNTVVRYVGGLVGYAKHGVNFQNIEATKLSVAGCQYVGGILGYGGNCSMDNIHVADAVVKGYSTNNSAGSYGGYVGGIAGYVISTYTSNVSRSAKLTNLSVTGTPVFDVNGNVVLSTTNISSEDSKYTGTYSYVGGLVGLTHAYYNGYKVSATLGAEENGNEVNGILVSGDCSRVGGMYGYCRCLSNATVKDVLVKADAALNKSGNRQEVGGLAGYLYGVNVNSNVLDNIHIKTNRMSKVGIGIGQLYTGTVNYLDVRNSSLVATNDSTSWLEGFGALCGYTTGTIQCSTSYNNTIDTSSPKIHYTGGIVGHAAGGNIYRNLCYGAIADNNSPAAGSGYYVKGYDYVGGVVGYHTSGVVGFNETNINVIAENQYAGGITGLYGNGCTITLISGKLTTSHSTISMYYNLSAGTVAAKDYAGGVIGDVSMRINDGLSEAIKEHGGRNKNNGSKDNETNYTRQNLLVATSISTSDGAHAYAYCGTIDGFEGNANSIKTSIDGTEPYTAAATFIWEGMRINQIPICSLVGDGGAYRYVYFNDNRYPTIFTNKSYGEYNICDNAGTRTNMPNVRLVTREDLADKNMYRAIYWWRGNAKQITKTETSSAYSFNPRGPYHVMLTGSGKTDTQVVYANLAPYDGLDADYTQKAYLPQLKISTSNAPSTAINDYLTRYQVSNKMFLPIPTESFTNRATDGASIQMTSYMACPEETYGICYASDVDKINIEFSEDLVNKGYFIISYGQNAPLYMDITKRVYSFQYDFMQNISLHFGMKGEATDIELGRMDYNARSLRHHVMTYGSKYYYISDIGIISGDGPQTDGSHTRSGSFVSIYKGKALSSDGVITDMDGNTFGSVAGLTLLDTVTPLASYYINGKLVNTFGKFSLTEQSIVQEAQIIVSAQGSLAIISGGIENVKDSVVVYEANDNAYCMVLGIDGKMTDLYQGEVNNTPEKMSKSGIVYMTNNMNTSAPFVLVEYANGGMAGYNYLTGEYLFDNSIKNTMSLSEYAKIYVDGDHSSLESIANTYASNAKLVQEVSTVDRLYEVVTGHNAIGYVEGNQQTGITEEASGEEEETALAVNGVMTEGETAVAEHDSLPEEIAFGSAGNLNQNTTADAAGDNMAAVSTSDDSQSPSAEANTDKETQDDKQQDDKQGAKEVYEEDSNAQDAMQAAMVGEIDEAYTAKNLPSTNLKEGLVMVYNQSSGAYEIVELESYMTDEMYVSENEKLKIADLGDYAGFAQSEGEKESKGLPLYVIIAISVLLGLGIMLTFMDRFKLRHKRD